MNAIQITTNIPYWSELHPKLMAAIITNPTTDCTTEYTSELTKKLKNEINAFCKQGTGFQSTVYHFVEDIYKRHVGCTNKTKYQMITKKIAFLCDYLDIHYLKRHPRRKKTVHSIQDIADWHWNHMGR